MLYYVTGNSSKFNSAQEFLKAFNIQIEQKVLKVEEIQFDLIKVVAIDKARRAFEILKQPLFVNDSGWSIPALKGFPDPYMKYINEWFDAKDFIKLMADKENRAIILQQVVVYIDQNGEQVFEEDSPGVILDRPGKVKGRPSDMVISFKDGLSLTEQNEQGSTLQENVWQDLAKWLKR